MCRAGCHGHSCHVGSSITKTLIFFCAILQKYGGVYRDTDIQCIRPLDEIIYKYDFVAGIEGVPFFVNEKSQGPHIVLNNGLIAASPNHKVISKCMSLYKKK